VPRTIARVQGLIAIAASLAAIRLGTSVVALLGPLRLRRLERLLLGALTGLTVVGLTSLALAAASEHGTAAVDRGRRGGRARGCGAAGGGAARVPGAARRP
jgi:hypothetical protein